MYTSCLTVLAVHVADGVLRLDWLVAGWLAAIALLTWGAQSLADDEIPRVALMTSVFFVGSLIHLKLGPASVHLLLVGMVGMTLGRRAALAIPVGLFLQAGLVGHGGVASLGVNSCVLTLPALAAGWSVAVLRRTGWLHHWAGRAALVANAVAAWSAITAYAAAILIAPALAKLPTAFHFAALGGSLLVGGVAALGERRFPIEPGFVLGLFVGQCTVLAAVGLQALALLHGAETVQTGGEILVLTQRLGIEPIAPSSPHAGWSTLVLVSVLLHLPVAALEGVVLGLLVAYLERVRPAVLSPSPPALVSQV